MKRAFESGDASYDGVFFVGVRSTGIFCRPSCPARKPLTRNRQYFAAANDALAAGYRPCKRCRPLETDGTAPNWVQGLIRRIERSSDERITDSDLRASGIDPARARRYFRAHYGMTFQSYQRMRRLGVAFEDVRNGKGLLEAGYRHGYDSPSGFRDAFTKLFGKPPGRARDNGRCALASVITSPIGPLVVASTADGVCMLEFADRRRLAGQAAQLTKRLGCPVVPGMNTHLERLESELAEYFAGDRTAFTVPLVAPGTDFQETVWRHLRQIPYGQTVSYESVAEAIGRPGAQRAVGRANGDNRIAIVIPCHRVVQKDGKLRGYGGGLWRKQYLLDLERGTLQQRAATQVQ
jgi:AraC family transcriptional regulator of adaptative response/methylated-DNA-[protein]-cysteine methyltransferase